MSEKEISRYCEECVRFAKKECEGKDATSSSVRVTSEGTIIDDSDQKPRHGLNFCKHYEFNPIFLPKIKRQSSISDHQPKSTDTASPEKSKRESDKARRQRAKKKSKQALDDARFRGQKKQEADTKKRTDKHTVLVASVGEQLSSSDFDDLLID